MTVPVEWHIEFKIATRTFKALETGQPPYNSYALRSSTFKFLQVPHSFCVSAPTLELTASQCPFL